MINIKKLRFFAPLLVLMMLFTFVSMGNTKTAKADEGDLHIDVDKTVQSVKCTTADGSTATEIQGIYSVKNESFVPVILNRVRDWLSEYPFEDQPIGGSYALAVSDGGSFDSPLMVYDVASGGIGDDNPPFQNLSYGPIAPGETVVLNYTLVYQGMLPEKLYNSVGFTISGICDPTCESAEIFSDRVMFPGPAAGPAVCEIITSPAIPVVEESVEEPSLSPSPEVLGVTAELPQAGGDNQSWLYYLIIPGSALLAFSLRILLRKFSK